jgi:hypothetical protein
VRSGTEKEGERALKTKWTGPEWFVLTRILPLLPGDMGEWLVGRTGAALFRYGSCLMCAAGTVRTCKHPPEPYERREKDEDAKG